MTIASVPQAGLDLATAAASGVQKKAQNTPQTNAVYQQAKTSQVSQTSTVSEEQGPGEKGEKTEAGETGNTQASSKVNAYA